MRLRTSLITAIAAAAFAAMLWLAIRDSKAQRIRLPDGREFTVKAVTLGTEHRYVHGRLWARTLDPVVPNRWKLRLGIRTLAYKTDRATLMVWGHWRFSRTNSPANYAAVADAHGIDSMSTHYQSSSFFPKFEAIMGWNFSNYPRREKAFGFRLYPTANPALAPLAKVPIANPAPARTPALEPAPLPQTKMSEGVKFTLTEFTMNVIAPEPWRLPQSLAPWNTVTFHTAENGNVSANWRVVSFAVSDGSGNHADCRLDAIAVAPGEIRCRFNDVLWPEEKAHKLTAEFVRTANFASNELWTATAVPVPIPGNPVRISPNVELQGVKITSIELNATSSGPVGFGAVRPTAHLVLRTLPAIRGLRPVLRQVRDDQGRAVKFDEISLLQNGTIWFALEIPKGATNADYTFAITRTHFIDFVAQPRRFPSVR